MGDAAPDSMLRLPPAFAGVSAALASHEALAGDSPWPAEAAHAQRFAARRAQHFLGGRALARRLLRAMAQEAVALPAEADGRVAWPQGLCGSLAHCDTRVAAALAPSAQWRALGIDVEPVAPLPPDAARLILTARDRAGLAQSPQAALLERAVFCIKECVHKALYPLTGLTLEFDDVSVAFGAEGAVSLRAETARASSALQGYELRAVLLREEDHWVALVGIPGAPGAGVSGCPPPTA